MSDHFSGMISLALSPRHPGYPDLRSVGFREQGRQRVRIQLVRDVGVHDGTGTAPGRGRFADLLLKDMKLPGDRTGEVPA